MSSESTMDPKQSFRQSCPKRERVVDDFLLGSATSVHTFFNARRRKEWTSGDIERRNERGWVVDSEVETLKTLTSTC